MPMRTRDGVGNLAADFIGDRVAETPAEYVIARPTVYLDTTIPSFLTAWPSRDIERARMQNVTREWWELHSWQFDVRVSEWVYLEARAGDAVAAQERIKALDELRRVERHSGAEELANKLMKECGLPENANTDAQHVALAAIHALKFLLTWNYRHMANDVLRPYMMYICRREGYTCPRIVTPDEIMRLRTHV
jgi:hypothetical protein